MDTFTTVVMLLIAFMAWSMGFDYIFLGLAAFTILLSHSWGMASILILGIGAVYLFGLKEYWFVLFIIIIAFVLIKNEKQGSNAGGGSYSPELMNLLGGY